MKWKFGQKHTGHMSCEYRHIEKRTSVKTEVVVTLSQAKAMWCYQNPEEKRPFPRDFRGSMGLLTS
jgi:hypothetical protein